MSARPRPDAGAEHRSAPISPLRDIAPFDSPALEQTHRPHPHTNDPTGARVACGIVGRVGGTRQDELALLAPIVAGAPHRVPHVGSELPLVEQAGHRPSEEFPRGDLRGEAVLEDGVERHLATGMAPAGPRLTAAANRDIMRTSIAISEPL